MTYWTEAAIKAQLDGRFFIRDLSTGYIKERSVPVDYVPTHKPWAPIEIKEPPKNARKWTKAEEEYLFKAYNEGKSFAVMARRLKISKSLAYKHFYQMCLDRGIETKRANIQRKYDDETEARIISLRLEQNMMLKDVAKEMGMSLNAVCGIWKKYRHSNHVQGWNWPGRKAA